MSRWGAAFVAVLVVAAAPSAASAQLSSDCEYTGPDRPVTFGATVETVRVLTHNLFGKSGPVIDYLPPPPPAFCNCTPDGCPESPNPACELKPGYYRDMCHDRLYESGLSIATATPAYDIVAVQELYDSHAPVYDPHCPPDRFFDGIWFNGEYDDQYYYGRPNTGLTDLYQDGGQGIFSRHPTTDYDEVELNNHLEGFPVMGVLFARVWVSDELAIDTYNVHLHSKSSEDCDQLCRYHELGIVREFIHYHSANSGFPVLVMGDFNIGGPNPYPNEVGQCRGNDWYGDIMNQLGDPRDLWVEMHPGEDGTTVPADAERIDFMFVVDDPFLTDSPYVVEVPRPDDMSIVRWFVDTSGLAEFFAPLGYYIPDSLNVSDHWGLDATLQIRRRFDLATLTAVAF